MEMVILYWVSLEERRHPVAVGLAASPPPHPAVPCPPHSLAGLLTHPDAGLPLVQAPAQLGVAVG